MHNKFIEKDLAVDADFIRKLEGLLMPVWASDAFWLQYKSWWQRA